MHAQDGTVWFAFVLRGGDPADWDIDTELREGLGDAAAEQANAEWDEMVVRDQTGGVFRTVALG